MAAHTVDIKLSFQQFDMTPGQAGRVFRRNLLTLGGKTDANGYSLADCFLRVDEGAMAPGNAVPQPGAPPLGGPVANQRLKFARNKESYRFLLAHISDEGTREVLSEGPYFQLGAEAFDYVMETVIVAMDEGEVQEMTVYWFLMEILTDVGFSENSRTHGRSFASATPSDPRRTSSQTIRWRRRSSSR